MGEQDQFGLLQDFLMKEEEILSFVCEEDTENIRRIAPILKIGQVEFEEVPGEEARRSGRVRQIVPYYSDNPDMEAEPEAWERETFAGTVIIFRVHPRKGESWDESERYLAKKMIAGFALVKKSVYLLNGFRHSVSHDPELNSKNLRYGIYRITDLIQSGKIEDYAVFFMNVNSTGEMNSQIGRDNGTIVLSRFIKRLESILEKPEAVWRVGGDNLGAVVRKEKTDRFLEMLQGIYISYGDSAEELCLPLTLGAFHVALNSFPFLVTDRPETALGAPNAYVALFGGPPPLRLLVEFHSEISTETLLTLSSDGTVNDADVLVIETVPVAEWVEEPLR